MQRKIVFLIPTFLFPILLYCTDYIAFGNGNVDEPSIHVGGITPGSTLDAGDTYTLLLNADVTVPNGFTFTIIGTFTPQNGSTFRVAPGGRVIDTVTTLFEAGSQTHIDGIYTILGVTKTNGVVNHNIDAVMDGNGTFDTRTGLFFSSGDLGGSLTFMGDVNSDGKASPEASPGVLTFNNNLTLNGTYECELAGTGGAGAANGHDQLVIAGAAAIGGASTLNVTLLGGFTPAVGNTFDIMTFTSLSGTFNTETLPSCCTWDVQENATNITLEVLSLLPVELVDFKAAPNENSIALNWQTASETNNHGFEIQKSSDARNWQTIGFVAGNGSTQETHHYRFEDTTPFTGNNYYRLQQMDFDGTFEYSKTVEVAFKGKEDAVIIYPNPSKDYFKIKYPAGKNDQVIERLELIAPDGKLVALHQNIAANSEISIGGMEEGIYLVRVWWEVGQLDVQRLVVE